VFKERTGEVIFKAIFSPERAFSQKIEDKG